ncbi:MAG: hypothetical protein FWF87_08645 [Synergistaceae bacterium]|nr:hypothetical protein [Synergistaceae bacterium]
MKKLHIIALIITLLAASCGLAAADQWVGLWRNASLNVVGLYSLNADGTFEFRLFHLDGKKEDIVTGKYKVAGDKINMTDRIHNGTKIGDFSPDFGVDGNMVMIAGELSRRVSEKDAEAVLANPTAPYNLGGISDTSEHYTLENDSIPSVMKVVGQRNIVNYNSVTYSGGTNMAVVYWTDPADHTQAANDMAKYFQYLLDNDDFMSLKAFSGLPYEGGVEMSFGKNSVDAGNIIILDIDYNTRGYVLIFRKIEGTLTRK